MIERIETVKRYLWAFVELGFVALLAILLIYLLLGQSSGEYVTSVAGNVRQIRQRGEREPDRDRDHPGDRLSDQPAAARLGFALQRRA